MVSLIRPETLTVLDAARASWMLVINRFVAEVLDLPVEILLPEGGSSP